MHTYLTVWEIVAARNQYRSKKQAGTAEYGTQHAGHEDRATRTRRSRLGHGPGLVEHMRAAGRQGGRAEEINPLQFINGTARPEFAVISKSTTKSISSWALGRLSKCKEFSE